MDGLLIMVLFVTYTVLLLVALVEWLRQPRTRGLHRWVWLPVILVFSITGPLAFLLLGREKGPLATTRKG